jgi:hypothetical protein
MNDDQSRDRVLEEVNASTLDSIGPVGSQDPQLRILDEINELEQTILDRFPKMVVWSPREHDRW